MADDPTTRIGEGRERMMRAKQIYACVEQLDLAAQLLTNPITSYGRLALILTDNAVELMLDRQCVEHFWMLGSANLPLPPGEAKARDKALGKHFEEKPKFCCKLGVISEVEKDFILTSHGYRSKAYHQGILYEDIMHALAWEYHALACQLFGRFPPKAVTLRFDDKLTPAVRRHLGEKGINFVVATSDSFEKAARSLSQARPALAEELPATLSHSAVKRVDELQDDLTFLTRNHPDTLDEGRIIERLQFYEHMFGEHAGIAGLRDITEPPDLAASLQLHRAAWKPKIRRNPCPRWRARALALAKETNPAMSLRKYENLREQMGDFANMVSEAARSLSHAIELAINLRREMTP
jgi:hypothetical protein